MEFGGRAAQAFPPEAGGLRRGLCPTAGKDPTVCTRPVYDPSLQNTHPAQFLPRIGEEGHCVRTQISNLALSPQPGGLVWCGAPAAWGSL